MDEKVILAPMIKGIMPGLPEIGKIKIGMKGEMRTSRNKKEFQLPQKLDHFIITTLERGQDGNFLRDESVHQNLGQKPRSIPVSLLYDDPALNFQCRWACFTGTQLWCTGDGENAYRKQKDGSQLLRTCPCERNQPDFDADQYRCKPSGVLSVVLNDMAIVGGVYKFRTTSYNSVINLMSSLALIQRITGGVLAGIPLHMTVRPKTVIIPKTQKTMQVWIVGLEYRGSVENLAQIGFETAMDNAKRRVQIEDIETVAKQMIGTPAMLTEGESEQDIAEEFYPEARMADEGLSVGGPVADARAWKPEDFDDEFEDEISQSEWAEFWNQAVVFHAEQGIDEDKLKVDIVSGDVANFRVAFNKFATEKQAENKKANKPAPKKRGPGRPKKTESKTAAAQKKAELKAQADMLESEAYAGVEAYKEHYPDIYHDETSGKEPKSIKDCELLLERMQAARDARAESQDAGDDIPY